MSGERLMNAKELADRLGVSVDVVYRHTGEWPVVRIGKLVRFDYAAVLEYLEREAQVEAS
jgi:excisionase family DNA binding protein